jgi:hypothetical protein
MDEIIARAECYIKAEDNNTEEKARDVKERNTNNSERRNYYPPVNSDRATFKKQDRRPYEPYSTRSRLDDFTPLNTRP